jgi:3-hydroxyisobutyrate dehydrogenase-like beta-hydroxyacid dehydrogenase
MQEGEHTMEVGFIGLGKMGRPMVRRLLEAGHTVHVFNRSRPAMDDLAAYGALPAASAAQVAERSELVLTALPTPESVEQVYGQLVAAARSGQLFADHSTVSPSLNRLCADQLSARGAGFLDAPVSGGPAGAEAGTLTVMVGGDAEAFERAQPALRAFGQNIRLCGPVGAGQVIKLVNQLLVAVHTSAIAEATVFGVKLGADPQVILELIGTSFGSSAMLQRNLPRFAQRNFSPATPVSLILKDLGVIHDEARAAQVPLLLGALAEQRFVEAVTRGLGEQDMAAIVSLWEEASATRIGASALEAL